MALDFPDAPTIGQTYVGSGGSVWTWDGVKWLGGAPVAGSGLITASQIDYDTLRLTAVGTKLKALGPLTSLNSVATPVSAALDGALNQYIGSSNCTWNLPAGVSGMCLGIMLTNTTTSCTITPAGSDALIGQAGASYSNSFPMVIPPCLKGPYQILVLMFVSGNWASVSVASEISEAMGWVSRPVLKAGYTGGNASFTSSTWTKPSLPASLDTHGWYAGSTYTPKRAGRYCVSWQAFLNDASGVLTQAWLGIWVNSAIASQAGAAGNALPGMSYNANCIITMNGTTDYVEPYIFGVGPNPVLQGAPPALFQIFYLGA